LFIICWVISKAKIPSKVRINEEYNIHEYDKGPTNGCQTALDYGLPVVRLWLAHSRLSTVKNAIAGKINEVPSQKRSTEELVE
ncbi:9006_t:CDS:2, partial [Acaulospora colombiana]